MKTQRFRDSLTFVGLLLVMGCGVSTPSSRKAPRQYVPAEIQPGPGESIISNGQLDINNLYAAAVLVDGGQGTCSGVLGDSGGPCLREVNGAMELVGLAKTYYGGKVEFSEYTSTYSYLAWLRQEIARAESKDSN